MRTGVDLFGDDGFGGLNGEIGDLILQKVPGRTSDEQITIYDATGMALLDIAAGKAALDLAKKKNLGSDAVL